MFGRKTPLLLSIALFVAGSLALALARNMRTLIAGRVLQGIGGGGIDVLADVILADMTTLEERSLWLSLVGIPIAVGNIMGPVVSALFTARVSWRWLGSLHLPFLGASLPLFVVYLRLTAVDPDTCFLHHGVVLGLGPGNGPVYAGVDAEEGRDGGAGVKEREAVP